MIGQASSISKQTASLARIGPNALIQTVQATRDLCGEATLHTMLSGCHQLNLLRELPEKMVDERLFASMVLSLAGATVPDTAREVLHRSGELTAEYLLEHRIPRFFQRILAILPRNLALAALLFAIRKHAWTFTGSGEFNYTLGRHPELTVTCGIQPGDVACAFYGGTFTRLLQTLIDKSTHLSIATTPLPEHTLCRYSITYTDAG